MRYLLLLILLFQYFLHARTEEAQQRINKEHANKLNIKEVPKKDINKIKSIIADVEEIEILDIIVNKNNETWYKTKYGYIYGKYIYIDIRYTIARFLHIREKPTTQSRIKSFHLPNAKVIVIGDASYSDGYHWVLSSDGYVASKYLTKKIQVDYENNQLIISKTIPFRLEPSLVSKIIKDVPRKNIRLVVPAPEFVKLGQTLEESKKEYFRKLKLQKELSAKKLQQNEQEEQKLKIKLLLKQKQEKQKQEKLNAKILLKQEQTRIKDKKQNIIKDIPFSLSLNELTVSLLIANNKFAQTDTIGTKPNKAGEGISLKIRYTSNYLMNNKLFISEIEYIKYSLRTKTNLLIGIDKFFTSYHDLNPYLGVSGGISRLNWIKDPLLNSYSKNNSSYSWIVKIGSGFKYTINKNIVLDFNINQQLYKHFTTLIKDDHKSTIDDTKTLALMLGLCYYF